MQSDRHARIKDRAYHIWVAEGRPHGKHDEHWHRAEREVAEEDAKGGGGMAAPAQGARAKSARGGTTADPARPRTPRSTGR